MGFYPIVLSQQHGRRRRRCYCLGRRAEQQVHDYFSAIFGAMPQTVSCFAVLPMT